MIPMNDAEKKLFRGWQKTSFLREKQAWFKLN